MQEIHHWIRLLGVDSGKAAQGDFVFRLKKFSTFEKLILNILRFINDKANDIMTMT